MISFAYAQGAGGSSDMMSMLFLPILLVVMFLFVVFPQMKRNKEHKAMIAGLQKGDEVVAGGMLGKVVKVGDTYIGLEIADNTTIQMQKSAVAMVLPKGSIKNAN